MHIRKTRSGSLPKTLVVLAAILLSLGVGGCGNSGPVTASAGNTNVPGGPAIPETTPGPRWIGAWGTAQYGPYPLGPFSVAPGASGVGLPVPTLFLNDEANEQSFRMVVHPTIGGEVVRVRLSNLMGTQPVTFSPVHLAKSAGGTLALVPGSDVALSFGGQAGVAIPAGAEAVSDAIPFSYSFGDDLVISFHVVGTSGPITWHAISFAVNGVTAPMAGDTTSDPSGASFTQATDGWFFVSGIDVQQPNPLGTIVALGSSSTDGAYSTPGTNTRWPDYFAKRLQAQGVAMGVLNEGIVSNTVTPVLSGFAGPPAVERFQRDVLDRPGVRSVVIFEGTNDLAQNVKADELYAAVQSLVDRAHAAGLCVVVATNSPRADTGWNTSTMEPEREKLNTMLRADTDFEGLADFDAVMRNPLDPTLPFQPYYFADQLHPNSVGMSVLANAVPIEALVPPPAGRCTRRPPPAVH